MRKNIIKKYCLCGCNKLVKRNSSIFFEAKCHIKYQYDQYIIRWKKGQESGYKIGGIAAPIRRYLKEKYKEKCAICGWDKRHEITGKVPVEVEHKDGNYKNCTESNLILLCPNCHSLTPTFRNLNKGKGREFRRKNKGESKMKLDSL